MSRRALRTASERGAAVVEFALILPLLLILVFGIIQYSWYFYSMQRGTSTVADVTRRITIGNCTGTNAAADYLYSALGGASQSTKTEMEQNTTVLYTDTSGATSTTAPTTAGGYVTVSTKFKAINFGFFALPIPNSGFLNSSITARVETVKSPAGGCP